MSPPAWVSRIALGHGALAASELAAQTRCDDEALYRLLRALAAVGLFHDDGEQRFSLTSLGEGLRTDAPNSQAAWACFVAGPSLWQSWGHLLHSVQSGENAFRHVHGSSVWAHRSKHLEESAIFDLAMRENSASAAEAILVAHDFSRFRRVIDVGGGDGVLLARLVAAHSGVQGTLFDQVHVVARAGEVFRAAGVADRCDVVGGDFFKAVPGGGDAYLLKFVLHDWQDDEAIAIPRACRAAMTGDATLVLIERLLAPPNHGAESKFSDLNMLVNAGGRERTEADFRRLLAESGFRLARVVPTTSTFSVFKAQPE